MKVKYKVGGGCVLCLMCVYQCSQKAISVIENVSARIDSDKCIGCGRCYDVCQGEAIIPVRVNEEEKK